MWVQFLRTTGTVPDRMTDSRTAEWAELWERTQLTMPEVERRKRGVDGRLAGRKPGVGFTTKGQRKVSI